MKTLPTAYQRIDAIVSRARSGRKDRQELADALQGDNGVFVRWKRNESGESKLTGVEPKAIRKYVKLCEDCGLLDQKPNGKLKQSDVTLGAIEKGSLSSAVAYGVTQFLERDGGVSFADLTAAMWAIKASSPRNLFRELKPKMGFERFRTSLLLLSQAGKSDKANLLIPHRGTIYEPRQGLEPWHD